MCVPQSDNMLLLTGLDTVWYVVSGRMAHGNNVMLSSPACAQETGGARRRSAPWVHNGSHQGPTVPQWPLAVYPRRRITLLLKKKKKKKTQRMAPMMRPLYAPGCTANAANTQLTMYGSVLEAGLVWRVGYGV